MTKKQRLNEEIAYCEKELFKEKAELIDLEKELKFYEEVIIVQIPGKRTDEMIKIYKNKIAATKSNISVFTNAIEVKKVMVK